MRVPAKGRGRRRSLRALLFWCPRGRTVSELLLNANALKIPLADSSVDMCVTSPPYYGLRDYQVSGQLGLEDTPEAYVANMVAVFLFLSVHWILLRER